MEPIEMVGAAGPSSIVLFSSSASSTASESGWFEFWSVLVAAVAAMLAGASLLTQLREAYWSRPVIVLDTSLSGSPIGWDAEILVTNVGERAVTITRSGWWYSFGTHWEDVHDANSSVQLPHRLEPHDAIAIRGRIAVDEAHWDWANGGLFKRSSFDYGYQVGAWRDDSLPDHEQYAAPFVEIVRRPPTLVNRVRLRILRYVARRFRWNAWNPLARQGAPNGHARLWGKPKVISAPEGGL